MVVEAGKHVEPGRCSHSLGPEDNNLIAGKSVRAERCIDSGCDGTAREEERCIGLDCASTGRGVLDSLLGDRRVAGSREVVVVECCTHIPCSGRTLDCRNVHRNLGVGRRVVAIAGSLVRLYSRSLAVGEDIDCCSNLDLTSWPDRNFSGGDCTNDLWSCSLNFVDI